MKDFPNKLTAKIDQRITDGTLRELGEFNSLIDFSSNDYLGFTRSIQIHERASSILSNHENLNGASGSRLLSGNHPIYRSIETKLKRLFGVEDALVFSSGYNANLGFFQCVPQRGDIILYDELIHASIREGIRASHAKAYKFDHNSLSDLELKLQKHSRAPVVYVVTESVFSMDGDTPNLKEMVLLCESVGGYLVVDEAHATGVAGKRGLGIVEDLHIADKVFARIITFSKALGAHGAAVLGSKKLIQYLTNFAKSFIYTTGLSPHSLATIQVALNELEKKPFKETKKKLGDNIQYFKNGVQENDLINGFIPSDSTIHSLLVKDGILAKQISISLKENGFQVLPILYPTVAKGRERLRICLHSYNSSEEIDILLQTIQTSFKSK